MSRSALFGLALVACCGCGKYGPPVRTTGEATAEKAPPRVEAPLPAPTPPPPEEEPPAEGSP